MLNRLLAPSPVHAPSPTQRGGGWLGACVLVLGSLGNTAWAQTVSCHLAYAGFERTIRIPGVTQASEVPPQIEGPSFTFHVLNKTAPFEEAAVTISTYTHVNGHQRLMHQAIYRPAVEPVAAIDTPYGFTGLQVVQEPQHGREWRYWCERTPH